MNKFNLSEKIEKLSIIPQKKLNALRNLNDILKLTEEEKKNFINTKLLSQVNFAAKNSKFYSKFYEENNINVDCIKSIKDFERLPFVTKENLRDEYPWGFLATDIPEISRYAESTGTTGRPTSAFFSHDDWSENNIFVGYRLIDIFSPEDIVVIAAPYELSIPAQDLERVLEIIGSTVIACGVLNEICSWERLISIIRDVKPTVLVCSGTRSLVIAETAEQLGYQPDRDFSIKTIFNIGENMGKAKSKRVSEIWNSRIYNAFGMTETCALGISCLESNIHLFDERFYFETIDIKTNEVLPYGEIGELTITSLSNKSMPLIRYRTGDLVRITNRKCNCSDTSLILEHLGRINEDIININGTKLTYMDLEEIIMGVEGHNKFYQVEFSNKDLRLKVDIKKGCCFNTFKSSVLNRLPTEIHAYVTIEELLPKEREELINSLKMSLKPGRKLYNFNKN